MRDGWLGDTQHTVALGEQKWVEDPRQRGMAVVVDGTFDVVDLEKVL